MTTTFNFRKQRSADLQAGSTFGYRLLFVVLVSCVMATILQVGRMCLTHDICYSPCSYSILKSMATNLGCVTGRGSCLPSTSL